MAKTIDKSGRGQDKMVKVEFTKNDSVRLEVPRSDMTGAFDRITVPVTEDEMGSNGSEDDQS